ncbi:MAG: uroporphyrinogen decarboxylase family protein [Anaerolineae bacterium]
MSLGIGLSQLPKSKPQPDAARFVRVLMGQERAERPPLVEYLVDPVLRRPIVSELLGRPWVELEGDRAQQAAYWDNFIHFWYRMGYDFVRFETALPLPHQELLAPDPAPASSGDRHWRDLRHGTISSWADFEAYPWPRVEDFDFFPYEYLNNHLPDGMGLIVSHAGGMYEHLSAIFSYEGLCYALFDQPDLVAAVCQQLGERMLAFYRHLVELDRVIALFPGDDMGFRSGTLIAPNDLRRYTLPWHAQFAALAHAHNLPYFLHSCGNLEAILPDLIDTVRIDGKHSYEDAILPVAQFQARYGNRIAVLGGVDVDVLARRTPEQVRAAVRATIEACAPRGRFAIGSGNSIPSYVPVENYLAMLDEALSA